MWRVARAAHHDPEDEAALFPDAMEDARDGLPNEPHPRVQLEEALWYEVMHNKALWGWANCGDFPVIFFGGLGGWEVLKWSRLDIGSLDINRCVKDWKLEFVCFLPA